MLDQKTVFVIGAGASAELGLPIGEGLKYRIIDALAFENGRPGRFFKSDMIQEAVRSYVAEVALSDRNSELERYVRAASIICRALPDAPSIDEFLDSRKDQPHVVTMGKLAIAAAILNEERISSLSGSTGRTISQPGSSEKVKLDNVQPWHSRLLTLLTRGRRADNLSENLESVSFIVFNYDRCLEQYLFKHLQSYYNQTDVSISRVLKNLEIVHPYGQVGFLPWQQNDPAIEFGSINSDIRYIADEILTFTESERIEVVDQVKDLIANAVSVVFLGFGFLQQNIDLLTPVDAMTYVENVYFTSFGFSQTDVEVIKTDIHGIFSKDVIEQRVGDFGRTTLRAFEEKLGCADLMKNHALRMSRGISL